MKLQKSKYYLLGVGSDPKTSVDLRRGWMVGILYLTPADLSGRETCFSRSPGCTAACYYSAGRGVFQQIQESRLRKTHLYFDEHEEFARRLRHDVENLYDKATKMGFRATVRLNGTSDIPWEAKPLIRAIMEDYPEVQFYDYTKIYARMTRSLEGKFPSNYYLIFSRSEENWESCKKVLKMGGNVAAVFQDDIPPKYEGWDVILGDGTDLRFLEGGGKIIGLVSRGKGKKDDSGFVIQTSIQNVLKI